MYYILCCMFLEILWSVSLNFHFCFLHFILFRFPFYDVWLFHTLVRWFGFFFLAMMSPYLHLEDSNKNKILKMKQRMELANTKDHAYGHLCAYVSDKVDCLQNNEIHNFFFFSFFFYDKFYLFIFVWEKFFLALSLTLYLYNFVCACVYFLSFKTSTIFSVMNLSRIIF